jgi:hypothetical protein
VIINSFINSFIQIEKLNSLKSTIDTPVQTFVNGIYYGIHLFVGIGLVESTWKRVMIYSAAFIFIAIRTDIGI